MPTALISVYRKEGIGDFARELTLMGWDLLASGGTAKALRELGLPVRDVAELVGGGPILGHRVVTLSREIAAGLLAKDTPEDRAELMQLGIPWINLVCVDLYPLRDEIIRKGATEETVLELTDIGGPTLLSEAAKGRRIVISGYDQRREILDWLKAGKPDEQEKVRSLAAYADYVVAHYRSLTAGFHSDKRLSADFGWEVRGCAYGENAWQTPAYLYANGGSEDPLSLDRFVSVAGASPSYNNWVDVDRMLQTVTHIGAAFDKSGVQGPKIAVAVKHGNPCGAAVGPDPVRVLQKTVTGDKRAIFGGLVMTNFEIDEELASVLRNYESGGSARLLDGIVAPSFTEESIQTLKRRGDKCRFLANPALASLTRSSLDHSLRRRQVRGGYLLQPNYTFVLEIGSEFVEVYRSALGSEADLLLAWAIGSTSNSNTITLVKDGMLIGNGVGQQDRVGCCELAIKRAEDAMHKIIGAVAYSDSFFPFPDGVEVLAKVGVKAILTSSGSVNDDETRRVSDEYGVGLYMIPDKIGRGFSNH